MFRLLKFFFSFIWTRRRGLFFIFIFTALFFVIRFPWNQALEKTVKKAQESFPPSFRMDFERLRLKLFPPGIELQQLSLNYKGKAVLLDSLRVSPALSQWLAFKKAWGFKAAQGDSSLSVVFRSKKRAMEEGELETPVTVYLVKGHSPSLDLKALSGLFPRLKMSGRAKIRFDYEGGRLERMEDITASFNLKGKNIRLSRAEFQVPPLGHLSLPSVKWSEAEVVSHLKEGDIVFKVFRWGAPTDDVVIQMKGSGSIMSVYGRVRLNSYNVQLQIDVSKNFQMRNMLDLMFADYKEDKGSFYRYRLRLAGQGNQFPNMEKLTEF